MAGEEFALIEHIIGNASSVGVQIAAFGYMEQCAAAALFPIDLETMVQDKHDLSVDYQRLADGNIRRQGDFIDCIVCQRGKQLLLCAYPNFSRSKGRRRQQRQHHAAQQQDAEDSFLHVLFPSCSCRFGLSVPPFFWFSLILSRKHSAVIAAAAAKETTATST